ncbi:M15 family metallopeptidase [Zoogloea ramigera]|uniref:M15 family metallopeptidase n=1 Tax=Zoogloea ramigera TaxID=350 RepID=UPI003FA25359
MIVYGVLVGFLAVAGGVLLCVFPGQRARLAAAWRGFAVMGGAPVSRFSRRLGGALLARPAHAVGAVLLVAAPTLLVFGLRGPAIFDFGDEERMTERQIAILLEGEQLVPPPPLPPAVFTTREVEQVRPDIAHASRNWRLLDAEFTQRLLVVFKLMEERHGYRMALIEGYRSPERQARLFEQGSHVTQARANMSYHQHGLAADLAFFRDGKVVISERDPWAMRGYELYGEIAEQVGLTWGGRWKMRDLGHVELRRKGVLGRATGAPEPAPGSTSDPASD